MIPLEPLSLETKIFFLSAVEFGARLFQGPGGPDGENWLELVLHGPAELANLLPDHRPAAPDDDPDFAIPALLARLTERDEASGEQILEREFTRLFAANGESAAAPQTASDSAMPPGGLAGRLARDLETLTALLAKGWLAKEPDRIAQAGTMCRDALTPCLAALHGRLATTDRTGVHAAAVAMLLSVVRGIGRAV
ncbi:hypothetical protein [Desulfolutivibrio sulfoxidireducens]|uniref:hypothetical protein n=1 Tax=Desulfolutivibrio sulfoxidireducens TaxID=2773299 RepID=UPI00159E24D3|nr:hypothetical protein [Desulfolutivibrio sulfoxidireducens]QLA20754.1 hypothetical protein GD604_14040 [Desulfolutivibrio sulfoxidireducens]